MLRMALFRLKPLQCGKTLSAPPGVPRYASSISHLRSFSTPAIVNDDRPLAGIKVVDLTRILAGPFATMMLSDLGADVIKIESPKNGDDTRSWLPPSAPVPLEDYPRPDLPPESAYFMQANRNKRSLTLNLKSVEGQKIIKRLIEEADVLVENYVPGKLKKFGLSWEEVKEMNPRLIYCSITGYGSTGPYSKSPGYDVVIEAEAGLMHITGEKDGKPVKVGVAVTDVLTGHYAQSGILAALLKRQKTGKGSRVECSLFESQIASLCNIGANYLIAGQEATRWGTSHPSIVPYQVFPTKDSFIMLSAGNDSQFAILCSPAVLNKPDWLNDDRFSKNHKRVENRDVMISLIEEVLSEKTTEEWCQKLTGKGLPFAPINNIAQTFSHPQAIAREVVEEVVHPRAGKIKLAAPAVTYDGSKPKLYRPPPYLGQHTEEVLTELGYNSDEIKKMQVDGAI
ncbi:L-carnitine dehydratase/bile acid-inducible protein F [Cryptococcus gattii Ru294]|nr:L-carnitine dehydratase/bile acid-inducible protein F [Cryptococcus gattii Ru294]